MQHNRTRDIQSLPFKMFLATRSSSSYCYQWCCMPIWSQGEYFRFAAIPVFGELNSGAQTIIQYITMIPYLQYFCVTSALAILNYVKNSFVWFASDLHQISTFVPLHTPIIPHLDTCVLIVSYSYEYSAAAAATVYVVCTHMHFQTFYCWQDSPFLLLVIISQSVMLRCWLTACARVSS